MPELPEVETVRRGLAPVAERAEITRIELRRPDLRFPFGDEFVKKLEGRFITGMGRRAKYLLADIDNGQVLVMHLGMSGSFRIERDDDSTRSDNFALPKGIYEKHDHVVFHLKTSKGSTARIIYNDPRRFGFMTLIGRSEISEHPWFAEMGIEPTGNALDGLYLAKKFAGRSAPLKAALLNQKMIAGLGNIYVCEALWRAGLSPKRSAGTIVSKSGKPSKKCAELAIHIRDIISEAIEAGGSSLRDHRQTDGSLGYFQHSFAVYGHEGESCKKSGCSGKVHRITQSGRSTFYCTKCQK